jgi:hypothetical protein
LVRKGGKSKYSDQSGDYPEEIMRALGKEKDERWTEEGREVNK